MKEFGDDVFEYVEIFDCFVKVYFFESVDVVLVLMVYEEFKGFFVFEVFVVGLFVV